MTPDDLLYQKCSECLNEGWLFCTLCHKYFCDDHACQHLAAQVDKDTHSVSHHDAEMPQDKERTSLEAEALSFFHELGAAQLLEKSEMELRSYFRRLLQEAKRVQREIERRMIYATELSGGPAYRRQPHMSAEAINAARRAAKTVDTSPMGVLEREAKEQRAREREQKKQQTIQASIALLAKQVKLGNISIDQLKKIGAKK
jgi:hypothetical protein